MELLSFELFFDSEIFELSFFVFIVDFVFVLDFVFEVEYKLDILKEEMYFSTNNKTKNSTQHSKIRRRDERATKIRKNT